MLATLLGDVATTYIGIRTLQTQIEIARENIVKQKKALAIAQAKYHGGTASKLDVYQAENVLGQTESTIPQLTNQMNQGLNALAVLLGMPPQPMDDLLRGSSGIPVPPKYVAVGIPADLVRRRPDIRAAELAALAQSAQIGIAEANLYPAFSLTGSFGTAASKIGQNKLEAHLQRARHHLRFRAGLQWNILNYGQITNTVRVRGCAAADTSGKLSEHGAQGAAGGRERASSFLQGREQVDYLRQSVAAAESRAQDRIDLQYNLGTRDFTTVLTAEQNLYTAQNDLAMAEGNVSTGLASVYRALGGGWQIRDGQRIRACRDGRGDAERAPTGASCCRPRARRSHLRRRCRSPKTSVRTSGRQNGEVNVKIFRSAQAIARLAAAPSGVLHRGISGPAAAPCCRGSSRAHTADRAALRPPVPVVRPRLQSVDRLCRDHRQRRCGQCGQADCPRRGISRTSSISRTAQSVKKGDLLFTIQQDQYKDQLRQAQAQVLAAQASLRMRRPNSRGIRRW